MKNGTLIRQVVNKINEIDFNRSEDRHLFGDIYEQILKGPSERGEQRRVLHPARRDPVHDRHRRRHNSARPCSTPPVAPAASSPALSSTSAPSMSRPPRTRELLQASIRGVEKKQLPHLLCMTNMLLHGIDVPTNIAHDNTLARPLRDYGSEGPRRCHPHQPAVRRHGGGPGIENNFPQTYRTRETADLFLVLIDTPAQDRRASRGRAPRRHPLRRRRQDAHQGEAAHRLQPAHHRAAAEGRLQPLHGHHHEPAVLHQGRADQRHLVLRAPVSGGLKNYSKTKPIRIEEFDAEKAWWDERVETEVAWKVSVEDIRANNWNLDVANPNKVDAEHRDPEELLKEYQAPPRLDLGHTSEPP